MSDAVETRAAVDNGTWDGPAAMSRAAKSDDPAAAYRAICAGRRDGDPALQSTWALPHHAEPGAPPNANGVRNCMSRFDQTEGLTNTEAARAHLDAHMAEIRAAMMRDEPEGTFTLDVDAAIEIRDAAKRELDIRLVPWNVPIDTLQGREMFEQTAFDEVAPDNVLLMGMSHEARLGLDQAGRPILNRIPVGKATRLWKTAEAAYGTFRVAKTATGDEVLALAEDGIVCGASVEFAELPGGTVVKTLDGRRTRIHQRSDLRGVSTTYKPAYPQAGVIAVRSQEQEGEGQMAETTEAPAVGAQFDPAPIIEEMRRSFGAVETRSSETLEKMLGRLEAMEERQRTQFSIPGGEPDKPKPMIGEWLSAALRILSGERIADTQMRTLADIVTTDNVGVVPPTYSSELIGIIDPSRPFMQSTRRLQTPSTGMSLILPRIKTRPTVGQQVNEKDELTSTGVEVDTVTYDAVTKGGAGDISLQLLKRSQPEFLSLYIQLLAEAYALESEHEAVEAIVDLIGDYQGVVAGGTLDPDNLLLGSAFTGAFSAIRRPPDTIWLSSTAVAAFIDAKATTTNAPLYSQLSANFTAGGGVGGSISGLRAVHVPALDDQGYDVLVGPSSGFAWAEDGTYNLQVDVPAKAGRDVALVGMLWFAPLYPGAFTAYTLAS